MTSSHSVARNGTEILRRNVDEVTNASPVTNCEALSSKSCCYSDDEGETLGHERLSAQPSLRLIEKDIVKLRMQRFEQRDGQTSVCGDRSSQEEKAASSKENASESVWPIVRHSLSSPPVWGSETSDPSTKAPKLGKLRSAIKDDSRRAADSSEAELDAKKTVVTSPFITNRKCMFEDVSEQDSDATRNRTDSVKENWSPNPISSKETAAGSDESNIACDSNKSAKQCVKPAIRPKPVVLEIVGTLGGAPDSVVSPKVLSSSNVKTPFAKKLNKIPRSCSFENLDNGSRECLTAGDVDNTEADTGRCKPNVNGMNSKKLVIPPRAPPKPPRMIQSNSTSPRPDDAPPQLNQSHNIYQHLSDVHSQFPVSMLTSQGSCTDGKQENLPVHHAKPEAAPRTQAAGSEPHVASSSVKDRNRNKFLHQYHACTDGAQQQDAWEKKFIRAPAASRGKAAVISKKRLNNPCYMYATVRRPDDIIYGRNLMRHSSEEMLDAGTNRVVNKSDSRHLIEPVYQTPQTVTERRRAVNSRQVKFDTAGYAIPEVVATSNQLDFDGGQRTPPNSITMISDGNVATREASQVKTKVSNAYSVLRLLRRNAEPGQAPLDEDKDSDLDLEEHRKRLRHVTIVKQKTYEIVSKYERVKLQSDIRLFQYAMIIGLECATSGVKNTYKPVTLFHFPYEISDSDMFASNFCFPDADMWQPVDTFAGDLFSFVLTNAEGDRKFGWCWRFLPPGSGPRLPEAVCVVSPIGELSLYEQLLRAVEQCRTLSLLCAQELLQVAYARPFPAPNCEVYIRTVDPGFKKRNVILKRPAESRYNNVTFDLLLTQLSVDTLLQVFAALLLERKIVFCSKQLHTLTSCIFTVVALLYPFEWQHTFVTVLPSALIDLVEAPTPFILGIHISMVPLLAHRQMEEVLVVNLDAGSILYKVGDESRIIPKKIQKALTMALEEPDEVSPSCMNDGHKVSDATVTETFLRLFVETCGHYTDYICVQQNNEKVFQRELFVKAVTSRSIRFFLEWFTQTQMFEVFITGKLKPDSAPGLFEERIVEYRQEMGEVANSFRGNVKAVGKKIVDFIKDSGGKIKKTFQQNVFV